MAEYSIPYSILFPIEYPSDPLVFNPTYPAEGFYLTDVVGMDGAEIRAPIENIPQRDGAIVHRFFRGARHFTLTGQILAHTSSSRTALEEKLRGHTDLMLKNTYRMLFTPSGQSQRFMDVKLEQPVAISGQYLKIFNLSFVAADPATYTYGLPAVPTDITTGTSPQTLNNLGNTVGWPVLQIYGLVNGTVTVTNTTTSKFVRFTGVNVIPDTPHYIETIHFVETAFLDGTGINMLGFYDAAASEFWSLVPGNNVVSFVVAGTTSASTKVRVLWNHSYV